MSGEPRRELDSEGPRRQETKAQHEQQQYEMVGRGLCVKWNAEIAKDRLIVDSHVKSVSEATLVTNKWWP